MKNEIIDRLKKQCVVCGKDIKVIIYQDRTYRGGHYFNFDLSRLGHDFEYWECPQCYW